MMNRMLTRLVVHVKVDCKVAAINVESRSKF